MLSNWVYIFGLSSDPVWSWKYTCNTKGVTTNVHKFPLLSWGFFMPILPSVKANLHELIQCCLEFLTIGVSFLYHETFPKRPFGRQITDLSNSVINVKIPFLGVGALLVDDSHGLGNLTDTLQHIVIYRLFCPATHILLNAHVFCCPFAESNTGVLSPVAEL